ncbi:TPA: PTS transporter subunit EIIC [Streptococcus agalactiae]|nr:PTS transporter subunit EIIC [Streptococcus agalactiae]
MSREYITLSKNIIKHLGGQNNINNVYHCQTRLRFSLNDPTKVNLEQLKTLKEVKTVVISGGQHQIVIGTHVAKVFEEINSLIETNSTTKIEQTKKAKAVSRIIDFVSGTFQPILPALSGAGMIKALLALLLVFKILTPSSQTYILLNLFADGVFYFLPILIAITAAQKLKANPILALGTVVMLLHPNWANLVASGKPVSLFHTIPFTLTNYASSVIPIILIICVQAYIEKYLKQIIPKSLRLVLVPMLIFLSMGILSFSILGPMGTIAGQYLAVIFTFLSKYASWAPAFLVGAFAPILIMFGVHSGIAALGITQLAKLGVDSIFGPGMLCSNIAQATAGTVVTLITKEKKLKEIAGPDAITAYMGITEPILYGVNLPKRYPLIASLIGGGLGGLYAGIMNAHRFAVGSSGLPGLFLYISHTSTHLFITMLIAVIITVSTTAILTFILAQYYEKQVSIRQRD